MTHDVVWSGSATTYGEPGALLPPRTQQPYSTYIAPALDRHGVESDSRGKPRRVLRDDERVEMLTLWRRGITWREIARRLNRDRATVRAVCDAARRALREKGDA